MNGNEMQTPGTSSIEERSPKVPVIEVFLDPGNASKETIQGVFEALSDLHRAAGGIGLDFRMAGEADTDK